MGYNELYDNIKDGCDLILQSNGLITNININNNTQINEIKEIINNFFDIYPDYKYTIMITPIFKELREGNKRRDNPDIVSYIELFDKRTIDAIYNLIYPIIIDGIEKLISNAYPSSRNCVFTLSITDRYLSIPNMTLEESKKILDLIRSNILPKYTEKYFIGISLAYSEEKNSFYNNKIGFVINYYT